MKHISTLTLILLMAAAALAPGVPALTQTVNPADSVATIQTAINNVLASGDPSGEVVFNAGTYLLSASLTVNMNSDGDITLRGASAASRPIIVCPNYTGATAEDGAISIAGTTTTLTIKDLIFLPPAIGGGGPTNENTIGIGGRGTLQGCTLNFVNLLLTGNNGSNAPTSTDGLRDPVMDAGTASRFANACINLLPAAANVPTLIIGATDVICSQALAEGFYLGGDSSGAAQTNPALGGPRKAHYYNCVISFNAEDGLYQVQSGRDDRFYNCKFLYNGGGTAVTSGQQGIQDGSWNPGTESDGVGARWYVENCQATGNSGSGFFMGAAETGYILNSTCTDNGNYFALPPSANAAHGVQTTANVGHLELNGLFCNGNRGSGISGNYGENGPGTTTIFRNVLIPTTGVNNTSTPTSTTVLTGIEAGGETMLLEDVFVGNAPGCGFYRNATGATANSNVTLRRCYFSNCGMPGILLWHTGSGSNVLLENVEVNGACLIPAALTSPDSVDRGGGGICIRNPGLSNTSTFTLSNVAVRNVATGNLTTQGNGIRVEAAAGSNGQLQLSGVTVQNGSNSGATLYGGAITIDDCTVSAMVNQGLALNGTVLSVTDVRISQVGQSGVQVLAANPITMTTVEVVGAARYGVTFGDDGASAPAVPLKIGNLSYLCMVNNATAGVRVLSNQIAAPQWTLDRSTFLGNPVGFKMEAANFTSQPVQITNCILAGAGGTGVLVSTPLTSPISVHHCGLVQAGAFALATPTSDTANNPSLISTAGNVSSDPVFVSTTPGTAGFLDVRSTAYGAMGTGGTHLSGCADYIGDFVSIEGWRAF